MKHIKSAGHKASAAIRGASHKLGVGHSSPEGSPNTSPARKKHWYSRTGNRAGRSPETSPRDSGDARRHSRSRSRSAERVPIEALQKHAADSSSGAPRRNSAAPGAPSIAPVSPVSPKSPKSPKPRVAFVEPEKEEKEAREPNFDAFEIPEVEAPSSASAAANGPKGGGDKDIDEPSIFMDDDFEMDDPKAAADRMEDLWSSAPPDEKRGVELATAMRDMLDTEWSKLDPDMDNFWWDEDQLDKMYGYIEDLCLATKQTLQKDPYPLVKITSPVMVLGDIHGSYSDLSFFLGRMFDPNVRDPLQTKWDKKSINVATNVLVLQGDTVGVKGIRDVPDALTPSCRDLATMRRMKSGFFPKAMKTKKLLFLGDFVDRGPASLEVALYVMTLKVLYPGHVHLLRGNHETDPVSQDYGFKAQCQALFGTTRGNRVWWMVGRVFDDLPLAAVVDGKIFCSHGGIPQGEDGDDRMAFLSNAALWSKFRKEQYRATAFKDPKMQQCRDVFLDLLWADPATAITEADLDERGFGPNQNRGVSHIYGQRAVDTFLEAHGLLMLLRAHEKTTRGFTMAKSGKVVTVFTSSKYCGTANWAGVCYVTPGQVRAVTRSDESDDEGEEEEEIEELQDLMIGDEPILPPTKIPATGKQRS